MAKNILIIGGGLAGTIVANGLCRHLGREMHHGKVSISMIGNSETHLYQPGLLYVPFGLFREADLYRDQRKVLDRRIPYIIDPAVNVDAEKKVVTTESGKEFSYDYLVLATGSRLMPHTIPGMAEGAHWFYDLPGARKMRKALAQFEGGKIVINVNAPHKCPVAPLEITFMLHDFLSKKGVMDKTEILYTYPIARLHALEPVAHWAKPEMDRLGIKYETFFNTKSVDPVNKTITSEEGSTLPYDLLVTIPPHQGAQLIDDSGLGKAGWASTNRETLNHDNHDSIFVVGDTTNIPISKAGSTAHFEADTVVDNLTSIVQEGAPSRLYDGKVFCFVETGMDAGTYVWFNYKTPPNPGPPSQMIHWFKLAYNRLYWLSAKGLL